MVVTPSIAHQTWQWRGYAINYQQQGGQGPAVLLVHGFGASVGHWRKNLPVLAEHCRCYAIDLIGFGASAKPTPGQGIDYTFETWSAQIRDFSREIIGEPMLLIANSIGCIVCMQAAVDEPARVLGIAMLDCSLRLLHERKQNWWQRTSTPLIQKILQNQAIGRFFFAQLAQPRPIKNILKQAYGHPEAVTDELVEILLAPARDPGALAVFLAFTAYSQGPLPEDLLPQLSCPTIILWGAADPWEPIALGREFAEYPAVKKFIDLPGVGHCPQDEAPTVVNPILIQWIQEFVDSSTSS